MPETQPKVGHLRDVSTNKTDKTGRPLVTETQERVGHLRDTSVSQEDKTGRAIPDPNEMRGYQPAEKGQRFEPRKINDHIGPAEGAGY